MGIPSTDVDLWSDDALVDPYPVYAQLRDLGRVVYLDRHDAFAVTRYDEVRAVMRDWETFGSGRGVGVDETVNARSAGAGILTSDPPRHTELRRVLARQLGPRHLQPHHEFLAATAREIVTDVVSAGRFDAVGELGSRYSLQVVADLVGLPDEERDVLIERSARAFDTMGPAGSRTRRGETGLRELFQYCRTVASRERLAPDGWGADIYAAGDEGRLDPPGCLGLVMAYAWAGMDTTNNAIASAVSLFADHPDQWTALRADRSLMKSAVNEVIRIEPPVQRFTRYAAVDCTVAGAEIPAGSRLVVLFGSANRDEQHFADPDRFDIERDPSDHLGFGLGIHRCVGASLAQHELYAVLGELADRVERFDVVERVQGVNNALHGLERLVVDAVAG